MSNSTFSVSEALGRMRRTWPGLFPVCADPNCLRSRGRWPLLRVRTSILLDGSAYCGLRCLARALSGLFQRMHFEPMLPAPVHRVPLGLILMARGAISENQLRAALEAQRKAGGGRLGDWLLQLNLVVEDEITAALGLQWGCPVFPLTPQMSAVSDHPVPLSLLQASAMVPVHFSSARQEMHAAFLERPDYPLLYAIERLTGCSTRACVASRSLLKKALANLERGPDPKEVAFDNVLDPRERARIVTSYVETIGANEIRSAHCPPYVWLRLSGATRVVNVLFRSRLTALGGHDSSHADPTRHIMG